MAYTGKEDHNQIYIRAAFVVVITTKLSNFYTNSLLGQKGGRVMHILPD